MKAQQTLIAAGLAASFFFLGCSKTSPTGTAAQPGVPLVLSTTVSIDYSEGNFNIMQVSNNSVTANLKTLGTDDIVSTFGNDIYILERGLGNVIKLHNDSTAGVAVTYQVNLGTGVNPQQIAFVSSTKAYITQYAGKNLVIFNPSTGTVTGAIDLSRFDAYAGTDSAAPIPYMSPAMVSGSFLYVGCQRLKVVGQYPEPADSSCIAVISTQSDSIVNKIALLKKNPYSMDTAGGKLYVVCPGAYYVYTDGDVEAIDLASQTNSGTVLAESAVNGDLGAIAMAGPTQGYITAGINGTTYVNEVFPFNPAAKTVGSRIAGIGNASGVIGGIVCGGGTLYVGDQSSSAPGIVSVSTTTNTKIGSTAAFSLLPYSLAYFKNQ
jgi:hypothetical protein